MISKNKEKSWVSVRWLCLLHMHQCFVLFLKVARSPRPPEMVKFPPGGGCPPGWGPLVCVIQIQMYYSIQMYFPSSGRQYMYSYSRHVMMGRRQHKSRTIRCLSVHGTTTLSLLLKQKGEHIKQTNRCESYKGGLSNVDGISQFSGGTLEASFPK